MLFFGGVVGTGTTSTVVVVLVVPWFVDDLGGRRRRRRRSVVDAAVVDAVVVAVVVPSCSGGVGLPELAAARAARMSSLRARVDPQVGRQVVDRLLVARDRIDLVDRPVVPVVQEQSSSTARVTPVLATAPCAATGATATAQRTEKRCSERRACGLRLMDRLGSGNVSGGDGDESSGRAICARLRLCKATVRRGRHSQTRMLASNGMAARHANSGRRSSPALAARRRGALLRHATRATRRSRGSGSRRSCSRRALVATRSPPERARRARPARAARRLVRRSRSRGRSSPTAAGTTRTARSSTSPSRSSARSSPADPRQLAATASSALLGAVCVWSLAGKVLPWLYEDYGRIARLRGPVGYWNALALLGDIALPIGLCLATRLRCGRDAARLRLDRRDRADVLARRRGRRGRRRRALDGALARVDRGARDARRGRAAGGRRARPSPSPSRA